MEVYGWRKVVKMQIIGKENREWKLEELEGVFEKSIYFCAKKCLEDNEGRIYTTLSGGIDSSFCLAKMRDILGYSIPIHTLTIVGSKRNPDYCFSKIIASRFRSVSHIIIPDSQDLKVGAHNNAIDDIGDLAVFLLYKFAAFYGAKSIIAHDGIDELLGGYWEHREPKTKRGQEKAFKKYWRVLPENHLLKLERSAKTLGVSVILPYLQKEVVEYIAGIPVNQRTSYEQSKIPLRKIAKDYLPLSVIYRKKQGFCDALL